MTSSPAQTVQDKTTTITAALVLQVTAKGNITPNIRNSCHLCCLMFKGSAVRFIFQMIKGEDALPQRWAFEKECIVTLISPEKCSMNGHRRERNHLLAKGNMVSFCTTLLLSFITELKTTLDVCFLVCLHLDILFCHFPNGRGHRNQTIEGDALFERCPCCLDHQQSRCWARSVF